MENDLTFEKKFWDVIEINRIHNLYLYNINSKDKDRPMRLSDLNSVIEQISHLFEEITFKEQNSFAISCAYDPISNSNSINIDMKIYDGKLIEDYANPSMMIPCATKFTFSAIIIERFYFARNAYTIFQCTRDLLEFVKKTNKKIKKELKKDIPYEDIKCMSKEEYEERIRDGK